MTADEIKAMRLKAGLTQAEAALSLGVSQGTLSRWETGRSSPRPRQVAALRRAFSGVRDGGQGESSSPTREPQDATAAPSPHEQGASTPDSPVSPRDVDLPNLIVPADDGRVFQSNTAIVGHLDALVGLQKLPDNCVDLVFADPPYNIGKRFADFHDKWPSDEAYVEWCSVWLGECLRILKPNGSLYVMSSTQAMPYIDIWLRERLTILSRIVWHYDSSGVQARSYFGSKWEPILHCVKDPKAYTFNSDAIMVEAKTGAKRKLIDYRKAVPTVYNSEKVPGNVWYFPRVRYRMPEYEDHPSQKPEALLTRIVEASSNPGDVVLDPFAGTFTTGAVATRLGRGFVGFDSQIEYVKIGLRRVGVADELDGELLVPPEKTYVRRNGVAKKPSPRATNPQAGLFEDTP